MKILELGESSCVDLRDPDHRNGVFSFVPAVAANYTYRRSVSVSIFTPSYWFSSKEKDLVHLEGIMLLRGIE